MGDIDNIIPNSGLEMISFGCSPDSVRDLLGSPDSNETDEYGDKTLEYHSLGLCFTFWGDYDNRLGYIGTERQSASLNAVRLIGQAKGEVISYVEEILVAKRTEMAGCEHEDGRIQEWFDVDSLNLTFWFMDGSLSSIAWTCPWASEEAPW